MQMPGTGILLKISAVANFALLIAVALLTWRLDAMADQRDEALKREGVTKEKLATTQTSLDGCLAHIDDSNRRANEAAAKLAQARQEAAAAVAAANARWERTSGTVAALERAARATNRGACQLSDEARAALEGL